MKAKEGKIFGDITLHFDFVGRNKNTFHATETTKIILLRYLQRKTTY